jgi:hypothetical protein
LRSVSIYIRFGGKTVSAEELLAGRAADGTSCPAMIQDLIIRLNSGFDFGNAPAEEWMRYLRLFASGRGKVMMNPYSDLKQYAIEPITQNSKHLTETPLIHRLNVFSDRLVSRPHAEIIRRTLLILAVGGADTTFYDGMTPDEIVIFLKDFIPPDLFGCFNPSQIKQGIPRAFASKRAGDGRAVTNVESLILQAYEAGFRHVAVLSNASASPAITKYLETKFRYLKELKLTVTVQPLLPAIVECPEKEVWTIDFENGGYPGGHGHGFKYTLMDETVRKWIHEDGLVCFLFSNGDNAALFNGGANHFIETLEGMRALKREGDANLLRTAFYLVWEKFQKGGFSFFLRHKKSGDIFPQIFEVELAPESVVDVGSLKNVRGGYNTNVAVGFLNDVYQHLDRLPLALKRKKIKGCDHLIFEASFATALSTVQDADGASHFDAGSVMVVLAPDQAIHPQWIHISLRKRAEWLAYISSVFKIRRIRTEAGTFDAAIPDRDAASPLPSLEGNVLSLNSGEFFEVFRNAELDVDEFTGTLCIDFKEKGQTPRGSFRFERNVRFVGNGRIAFAVPAGETWVIKNQTFASPADYKTHL